MQQVADQPVHPFRLGRHDAQKAVAGRRIVARRTAQRFDKAKNRGQGRTQFVADIGNEIAAHLFGLLLVGHVLKQAKRPGGDG